MRNRLGFGLIAVGAFALLLMSACDGAEDPESRIYLEEESPNYFTAVYIVESPAGENGNWGSNLINDYETMSEYPWLMYRLSPGTYDIRTEMVLDAWGGDGVTEDFGVELRDQKGVKYCASDSGYFYITSFSF